MNDCISSKHDREIIDAGGFYCAACLVDKPLDDRSPDPRYCLGCYEFLLSEATQLPPKKRPVWIPRIKTLKKKAKPVLIKKCAKTPKKKHPPKIPPAIVFAQPDSDSRGAGGIPGGRPGAVLPVGKIIQWADQDMKVPDILKKLESQGIKVSRRTIYNILAGQRVLI